MWAVVVAAVTQVAPLSAERSRRNPSSLFALSTHQTATAWDPAEPAISYSGACGGARRPRRPRVGAPPGGGHGRGVGGPPLPVAAPGSCARRLAGGWVG